ncbi:hypothetical protein H9638_13350 [Arthrobacter sp. Sa2BUA2]|uniref:Uncharacterized protein n=1 Tax=Arthrobacter pullicola TaxID=2762224 RepID=A0ABR8YKP2_9MICC|nr:hypothetical protein [Arthrobacter pullicola]MBD8044793.1 hypothetical protein [Arthrobacter pullicola]
MEFVVIILFVAAIVLVNFLVGRAQRRRAGRPATPKPAVNPAQGAKPAGRAPAGASPEASREAVARLDEAGHRQVYAAIAQGQPIRAIQVYAQLTGCGLRAASAAVASLASHPVPYTRPAPKPDPAAQKPSAQSPSVQATSAQAPAAETPDTGRSKAADDTQAEGDEAAPSLNDAGETGKDSGKAAAEPASPEKAGKGSSAPGTPKDAGQRNDPQTLPDEAEISKWAQNLRPEDF